jgi:hypothetical protein
MVETCDLLHNLTFVKKIDGLRSLTYRMEGRRLLEGRNQKIH